jgi:hypothetical protein
MRKPMRKQRNKILTAKTSPGRFLHLPEVWNKMDKRAPLKKSYFRGTITIEMLKNMSTVTVKHSEKGDRIDLYYLQTKGQLFLLIKKLIC